MADDIEAEPRQIHAASHQLRIIRTVFIAALLLLACVAALAYLNSRKNAEDDLWVGHTYQVIIVTGQIFSDERGAAATARGYLLTGDPSSLVLYRNFSQAIPVNLDLLQGLVADNPDEVKRVLELRRANDIVLQSLAHAIGLRQQAAPNIDGALVAQVMQSHQSLDQTQSLTTDMVRVENQLLATRRAEAMRGRDITVWLIVAGTVVSLLVLLACLWFLTGEILSRRRAEARIKGLNQELEARNSELEASNNELEGFSYSISHDLRAPLRAIDGFSQLLQTRYANALDAEAMRFIGMVRDNSRNMGTLIDDLLAFSRMGRKTLETETLDMPALVGECIAEVLRGQPERPNIVVGPLPPCRGDRTLLRQVWTNLIGNAVKYSGQNPKALVEISGREEARECVYSVKDNGVGFDMQYYHKLFGVFQRLHRVEEFPGTGVGLAIAMRAVTKHGGRLWADAAPERGATFLFSLPRTESTR
ncbi:MAG TPA: ATP-binding protein [Gammaproteobacteria bacterium]|jgi:signal transduction histidine kinase